MGKPQSGPVGTVPFCPVPTGPVGPTGPAGPADDWGLSPYTGWTRDHWVGLAERMLAAARACGSANHAQIHFPGAEGGYGRHVDGLEGFARTFLAAGFLAAGSGGGLGGLDWYAEGFRFGPDPTLEAGLRWVRPLEHDQAKVEACSLALILHLTRPYLWDQLDSRTQELTVDYLAEWIHASYPKNNWVWFRLITGQFLKSVGGPWSPEDQEADLAFNESCYIDNGWYRDGMGRCFDYYSSWVFQVYPLLWCDIAPEDPVSQRMRPIFQARLDRHLADFVHLIGADGAMLAQGRSLIYRFAAAATLWMGAWTGSPTLSPGLVRRAASGMVRHFGEHGVPDGDGVLSMGWYGPWRGLAQSYSGPGSPYWACKGLLGLALPADHPVWTATEQPLPADPVTPPPIATIQCALPPDNEAEPHTRPIPLPSTTPQCALPPHDGAEPHTGASPLLSTTPQCGITPHDGAEPRTELGQRTDTSWVRHADPAGHAAPADPADPAGHAARSRSIHQDGHGFCDCAQHDGEPPRTHNDTMILANFAAPGWVVSTTKSDGIVRVINHGTDHAQPGEDRADSPLYANIGYSTATFPLLDADAWTTPLAQSVCLIDARGRASHRTGFTPLGTAIVDGLTGCPLPDPSPLDPGQCVVPPHHHAQPRIEGSPTGEDPGQCALPPHHEAQPRTEGSPTGEDPGQCVLPPHHEAQPHTEEPPSPSPPSPSPSPTPVGMAGSRASAHWVDPDPTQHLHGAGYTGTPAPAATITVISLVRGAWEVRAVLLEDVSDQAQTLRVGGWAVTGRDFASATSSDDQQGYATVQTGRLTSSIRAIGAPSTAGIRFLNDASPLAADVAWPVAPRHGSTDPTPTTASTAVPYLDFPVRNGDWISMLVTLSGQVSSADAGEEFRVAAEIAPTGSGIRARVVWPDGARTECRLPEGPTPGPEPSGPGTTTVPSGPSRKGETQ